MICSANEVTTLFAKAARGAGAPAGQSILFGAAALCHLTANRPAEDLRAVLDALPSGPIMDHPLYILRLTEAATNDQVVEATATPNPLLQSYIDAHPCMSETALTSDGLHIRLDLKRPQNRPTSSRVALSDELATTLQTLAAKTYVPDTAASRLSGAGAGLTDND